MRKFDQGQKVKVISKYPMALSGRIGKIQRSYPVEVGYNQDEDRTRTRREYVVLIGKSIHPFYSWQLAKAR